ncbi:MAG: hypothetical protein R3E86_00215 [Pseudomonadales bacterium]
MWRRVLLVALALTLAGNGLHMLFAPQHWYLSLDSVAHTGPFNGHFVRDIGCAYLAAAAGIAIAAWRVTWMVPGLITALAFVGPHAALHLWELGSGRHLTQHLGLVDLVGIFGPPLLVILILLSPRRWHRAREV